MTERWKIDDCTIIGAQGSLTGNAPFWRCPPLVLNENFPGRVGVVLMYAGDSVDVSVVPEQVYQEALEKNTWCKLSESELFRYADVWMLRANFPFTDFATTSSRPRSGRTSPVRTKARPGCSCAGTRMPSSSSRSGATVVPPRRS